MLKIFFLAPGRLISGLFSAKKKAYRSLRPRPIGTGLYVISAVFWLLLLGGCFWLYQEFQPLIPVTEDTSSGETAGAEETAPAPAETSPTLSESGSTPPPASASGQTPAGEADPSAAETVAQPETEPSEAWLVILHTIPKSARAEAERRQVQYRERGLMVEIYDTDAYPLLLSGHWIIAQGPFENQASALQAADVAKTYQEKLMVRRGM